MQFYISGMQSLDASLGKEILLKSATVKWTCSAERHYKKGLSFKNQTNVILKFGFILASLKDLLAQMKLVPSLWRCTTSKSSIITFQSTAGYIQGCTMPSVIENLQRKGGHQISQMKGKVF